MMFCDFFETFMIDRKSTIFSNPFSLTAQFYDILLLNTKQYRANTVFLWWYIHIKTVAERREP